MLYIDFACVGT